MALSTAAPVTAALALVVALLPGMPDGDHAPPRKCGSPAPPLLMVDGRLMGPLREPIPVDREDLHTVYIACMDPADSTIRRGSGIPVVSVWLKQGPLPRMNPALAKVAELQAAHRTTRGAFAVELRDLEGWETPDGVGVALYGGADAWMAVASVRNYLTKCVVRSAGWSHAPEGTPPGVPTCFEDRIVDGYTTEFGR